MDPFGFMSLLGEWEQVFYGVGFTSVCQSVHFLMSEFG